MKLYAVVGSPNSRKVLAVVHHLGLDLNTDLEIEYLDLMAGDLQQPNYQAINPNAMVPALTHGDLKLFESNAINQYLADLSSGHNLLPQDPAIRADIMRWLCWELAHFNQAFGTLAYEAVAKPNFMGGQGDPAIISWTQSQLTKFSGVLNKHMDGKQYLVGEDVTLADYAMIHVEFFKELIPFDWTPYSHLNSYFERMRDNPHWRATAPASPEAIGRKPQNDMSATG